MIGLTLEIFMPSLIYMSLGLGAIISGLSSFLSPNLLFQLIIFIVTTVLIYLWLRKVSPKIFIHNRDKRCILTQEHKKGILTKEVTSGKRGFIKIGSDEWPAITRGDEVIPSGKIARVIGIEGTRLVVTADEKEEAQQ